MTYTVQITRKHSTYLKEIATSSGTVTPPVVTKGPSFVYTVKAGMLAMSTVLTLTAEEPETTITLQVDSNTYTGAGGTLSQSIAVSTIPKTATVTVSSDFGIPSTVYMIKLSR